MPKKSNFILTAAIASILLTGCATTSRNYQPDIDALNARISTLQGQLSSKEEELSRMQNQLRDQDTRLGQAEAEKRILSEKLDSAMAELQAKSRSSSPKRRHEESDLK